MGEKKGKNPLRLALFLKVGAQRNIERNNARLGGGRRCSRGSLSRGCHLTLVGEEVQHGLQQEGQVAHGEARVAHSAGGVHQLVEEAHLHGGPPLVGT